MFVVDVKVLSSSFVLNSGSVQMNGQAMNEDVVRGNLSSLNWLLDDLVKRLAGAERAAALSADGLLLGRSASLDREDGEHLAAMASAFRSLARGVGTR